MKNIKVEIEDKKICNILLGSSVLTELPGYIKNNHGTKKIVVITDDNIQKLYGEGIIKLLKEFSPYIVSVQPGEASKSRETKQKIEDDLLDRKYSRDTLIIALGGGVIGDLAGFIASTFERGIPVVQVPTTLLAMADSSIGGKTGINTRHGKNLIGTIYQPDAVFADLNFLDNLPEDEFLNGLAEIIKTAVVLDADLLEFIEKNCEKIMAKEEEILSLAIKRSIELKKDTVEKDEKEQGLRQALNFGHTIGHSVEAYSGFNLKHGFCVSIGMAVESKVAFLLGELNEKEEKRIISILNKFSLPVKINKEFENKKLLDFMVSDKKSRNQKPRFVILKYIGKIKQKNDDFSFEVDDETIKKAIDACKND